MKRRDRSSPTLRTSSQPPRRVLWNCRRNEGVSPSTANTGDGAAEKRLKALNTEAAHINLDIENVRSAIDEAKRRLAAAERDEAMAAARENAEAHWSSAIGCVERAARSSTSAR